MKEEHSVSPRLGAGEKISFALGNIGNIPIMTLINSYLLIFYTDVCGLPMAAVGTLFLITKLLDGLNDPIMGFLVDHLNVTKLGRFRSCLLFGSIICGLNYLLLWLGPAYVPAALKLAVAYLSYILIGITFDLMDIPLNSLIPVMTDDMKQRNVLSLIKGASYLVGGMIVSVAAPLVITSTGDPRLGYIILICAAVAVVIVFSVIAALGVRERVKPISGEKYKLSQLFPMLGTAPVLIAFCATLLFGIGSGVMTGSNSYFATYVLGDLKILSAASGMSVIGMVPALILAPVLSNKFGKRFVFGGGLCVSGGAMLLRLLNTASVPLLYVSFALVGVGTGVMMTVMYGIQADNVDYVELRKNIRAEGAIASLSSFVTKAASGIGGALPAYIMAATGYVANQKQTARALGGITFSDVTLPAILTLAAGILFLCLYPITNQKLAEIEATLKQRREQAGKA